MASLEIQEELAIDLLEAYIKKILLLEKLKGLNDGKMKKLAETYSKLEEVKYQLRGLGFDVDRIESEIKSRESSIISSTSVQVFTDGAARGNNDPNLPNSSAIGFAVYLNEDLFYQDARYIGAETPIPIMKSQTEEERMFVPATNNTSEYLAIIAALEYLVEGGYTAKRVELFSDSNVVVQQINVTNATRADHLKQLRNVARELLGEFEDITITHIPREQNAYVDKLVNDVIDEWEAL
jgi:ribonuclease HI